MAIIAAAAFPAELVRVLFHPRSGKGSHFSIISTAFSRRHLFAAGLPETEEAPTAGGRERSPPHGGGGSPRLSALPISGVKVVGILKDHGDLAPDTPHLFLREPAKITGKIIPR